MRFRLTTRSLTISAILLTLMVVGIGAAFAATSTAQFCSSCKSHVPYVVEYEKSAHRNVNCEQCHTKPGPLFFLTSKLEALQQPLAQITGDYETPILGYVVNQSCRRCHTNKTLFKPVSKSGIRVQHKHLIEAGFLCMRCHSTVAHGTAVPAGSRTYPVMEQCLICHNNKYKAPDGTVASARCDLCHTKRDYGAIPSSHKSSDWSTRHGAVGVLSTCSACHIKKDSCTSCHDGFLMPHPSNWLYSHGPQSESRGRQSCAKCHEIKAYCKACHAERMPHPSGFLGNHFKVVARTGAPSCFNCHTLDNCQACHEQHAQGDPRAHSLFKGIQYTPPPRTPSATPVPGSQ